MTSDEAEARKYDQSEAGIIANLCSSVVEQIADLYEGVGNTGKDDIEIVTEALKASWAASRKDVDELLDCLTRAMEELGIAYLVTEQAPEDQRAIMNCLVKHGRVVIDGDQYRWKEEDKNG